MRCRFSWDRDGWPGLSAAGAALLILGLALLAGQVAAQTPAASAASGAERTTPTQPDPGASAPKGKAGGLAALRVEPETLKFDTPQKLGSTSVSRLLTLHADPAASAAAKYEVRSSGEFTVTPARCEIGVQGSCALSVAFAPTKAGHTSGALVLAEAPDGPTRVLATLEAEGVGVCNVQGLWLCTEWPALKPVLVLAALYAVAMLLARWNLIAKPTRELLAAEIDTVEARTNAAATAAVKPDAMLAEVQKLLAQTRDLMKQGGWLSRALDFIFWTRGQEHASRQRLHEAKEQLSALSPPERVRVALEDAEVQLRQLADEQAVALAERIQAELERAVLDPRDVASALLRETLAWSQRAAVDVSADVNSLAKGAASAQPAEMAALASRLLLALKPAPALCAEITSSLTTDMPPEYRLILDNGVAQDMLWRITRMQASLGTPPADTDEAKLRHAWAVLLSEYRDVFLVPAEALRKRIEVALAAAPVPAVERRLALLREALSQIYEATDNDFAFIASAQKKTSWLVGLALLLVTALAAAQGHAVLFLMGGLGGLMSRLSRALARKNRPTDFGESWTTLFLSPMVGALAGWGGVLLVILAFELQILGPLFKTVSWDGGSSVLALGLAVAFGFSERLFVEVIGRVEGKLGVEPAATDKEAAAEKKTAQKTTTNSTVQKTAEGVTQTETKTEVNEAVKAAGGKST